jgi:thymidylate synthase (FAD)
MDTWRQWIRHRTASVNEYSTRYSLAIDAASKTSPDGWRAQSNANRQGSGEFLDAAIGEQLTQREFTLHEVSRSVYQERIDAGVAREQARKDLPLSTYTEAYWKIDLHNLFHFLSLRMDSHAQLEIRSYANIIGNELVSRWCPIAWRAFKDYRLGSLELTGRELSIAKALIKGDNAAALRHAVDYGWIREVEGKYDVRQNRERIEAEGKLGELGLQLPWNALPA